ncbi:MAG: type II toxin-antitoxin system HicA family toxin [Syntrophales bacterium]|nr:type II toxin-antitoxin system HicA family toxin [Syntrophales bacterium]
MKSLSGKELTRLLDKKGWVLRRVRGSHHVYMKEGNPARISVPIHGNKPHHHHEPKN